jgi:polyisoprenoid-binding protein YceI
MKQSRIGLGLLFAAGLTLSAGAAAKLAKSGGASATFRAAGPAGLNIDGKTTDVNVSDDGASVTVIVGLKGLKTGIGLRDEHTQKALESDQYPTAEFQIARSALKVPAAGAAASGDARGTFKLHGKAKEISVHYEAKREGDIINVAGNGTINMTEFGIKPPTYLGVGVKPTVEIRVAFGAKDN